ncbi:plasmid mobilization protein [Chitinophaga sp. 22620]|uniref:plasmid mobilization protein n=1 Tax=Chitinophaga sp. 22620 TaxID=3453952 RepID=UPI003F83ED82
MLVKRNRGGRPRKQDKKTEQLAVMCTKTDRFVIRTMARTAGLTVSEYLLKAGLGMQVVRAKIPKEALAFTGRINHSAGLLNQIARKQNFGLSLSEVDKLLLAGTLQELQNLSAQIKTYLQ